MNAEGMLDPDRSQNPMMTQMYQETSRAKTPAVREYFSKLLDEIGASTKNIGVVPPMPSASAGTSIDLPGSPRFGFVEI